MKHKILTGLLIIISLVSYSQNGEIVLNITGIKTDNGKCLVYLFNSKKGFPTESENAIKTTIGKITNGKSTIVLKDISDGEYAITIIHDENDNGKLDTNFLGMPKEGVGVSNNAKGHFGPPSYNDAKFQLSRKPLTLDIVIKYL